MDIGIQADNLVITLTGCRAEKRHVDVVRTFSQVMGKIPSSSRSGDGVSGPAFLVY